MSSNTELARLRQRAASLAREGNWGQGALEINEKILEIDGRASDARTRLGRCYQEQGNFLVAFEEYRRALEADPLNTVARNKLRLIENDARKQGEKVQEETRRQQEETRRQQKEARKQKQKQKQKNKISSIVDYDEVYQLGLDEKLRCHYDLAIVAFLRAIELRPEISKAWVSLGSAYRLNGDPAEALRACERALELGADQDIVSVVIAAAKHMIGDTASAIEIYNIVLKHDNCNIYALNGLAALYNDIGDHEKARKLFGRVHYLLIKNK